MPLINRIEIANFMNRQRIEPWRPDWIHQVLNLNGYSTAINMPNGRGKTTIAQGVLAMLTHDRSLHDLRINHFAPQSTGRFTHLRVEVLIPAGDHASADLISQVGGGVGGDSIVFGMYGNAGENVPFRLYAYPGRLEDCPIGVRAGLRFTPASNSDFIARLEKIPGRFPSSARDETKGNWRGHVSTIFDMPAIEQQLAYQKVKGGEGSSGYFDVSVPGIKDYAEAVFYERLAPELLTDIMGGVEGHEDEVGLEDTIHAKVQGIIKARAQTDRAKKALDRTQRLLDSFNWAQGEGDKAAKALDHLRQTQTALAVHSAMMRRIVVDDPLPGLLRTPAADAPELASALVMQGEQWFIPDRAFEMLTGDTPSALNERAAKKRIESIQAERSQLIVFLDDSFSDLRRRGPAGRLYAMGDALALLAVTTEFRKLYTRESAIDAIHAAFDWAQEHGDTNPARIERRRLDAEQADLNDQHKKDQAARTGLIDERTRLLTEQRTVGAQQSAYEKMAGAGVFTAAELANPAETGQVVERELSKAVAALQTHLTSVARNQDVYKEWQAFVAEYGEDGKPDEIREQLNTTRNAADAAKTQTERDLAKARVDARDEGARLEQARVAQRNIEIKLKEIGRLRPQAEAFRVRFGNAVPQGLAAAVRQELDLARKQQSDINIQRATMTDALSALAKFAAAHPGQDPKAWLHARKEEADEILKQRVAASNAYDDLKAQRRELDRAVVAPGAQAREALLLAGNAAIALHAAVESFGLDSERKVRVLAMFSALLFAPTLPDVASASAVARQFADRRLDMPVFSMGELEDFCRNAPVDYDGRVASTWLVGVRTRPVDCLLDPALVANEKAALDARIQAVEQDVAAKSARLDELSTEHPMAKIAQSAQEAIEKDYAGRDQVLCRDLVAIEEQIPRLTDRSSDEALATIHDMNEYVRLLANSTLEAEEERRARAEEETRARAERKESLDAAVSELEENFRHRQRDLLTATEALAEKSQILTRVAKFATDGGPAFMQAAPAEEKRLTDEKAKAQARTGFEFGLAAAFVRSGGKRPQEIAARLTQIEPEVQRLGIAISNAETRREQIAKLLPDLISAAASIDAAARALRKQYRVIAELETPQDAVALDATRTHPLFEVSLAIRQAQTTPQIVSAWKRLEDAMDDDAGRGLVSEYKESAAEHQRAVTAFHNVLDRVKNDSSLPLDDSMRIGLEQAKSDPAELAQMLAGTQTNFEQSRLANEAALRHLDNEWDGIGTWLTNFTLRLPSNFEAMRRAFRPIRDATTGLISAAGFEIEATLADIGDVHRVLDSLVDEVEKREQGRAHLDGIEISRAERDSETRSLRRHIRNKFYRSVLLEPKIKICVPAISQKALKLEKNMFSSGQGIAVTLLWIVKMADYVTEREMRKENVGAAARRRLRDRRTQFVIIDGAFSHLSEKHLITDALDGVKGTRGTFQLIITGHDPNYRNDYNYFPSYIAAQEIGLGLMYADSETRLPVEPAAVGSHHGAIEIGSWHRHVGAA